MAGEWPQETGQGCGYDSVCLGECNEAGPGGANQVEKMSTGVAARWRELETAWEQSTAAERRGKAGQWGIQRGAQETARLGLNLPELLGGGEKRGPLGRLPGFRGMPDRAEVAEHALRGAGQRKIRPLICLFRM